MTWQTIALFLLLALIALPLCIAGITLYFLLCAEIWGAFRDFWGL